MIAFRKIIFAWEVFTVKNFSEFIKANKAKIYAHAQSNTKYNSKGQAVISRDDPWFYEDEWDKNFLTQDKTIEN